MLGGGLDNGEMLQAEETACASALRRLLSHLYSICMKDKLSPLA